jgi:hypothetical protein
MPLKKDYVTPATGATASYHVAKVVTLDAEGKNTSASVASYLSAATYSAGKAPLYTQQIVVAGLPVDGKDAFAFAEQQLSAPQPASDPVPMFAGRYTFADAEIVE